MTTAQTLCPDRLLPLPGNLARSAAEPSLTSRLRTLSTRVAEWFQSYDDYFAEIERTLPPHVREQRRERRESNRLLLIATLSR